MSRRSAVLPVLATVLLAACASAPLPPPAPAEPARAPAVADEHVDGATAKALVAGGARLVDVRTAEEFAERHIDGAVNVPVDTIGDRELGAKDAPLVLYCGSGARAARAAGTLRAKGYTRVYELGAMSSWDK
jgi:rhodanese-related sulfurtransferase